MSSKKELIVTNKDEYEGNFECMHDIHAQSHSSISNRARIDRQRIDQIKADPINGFTRLLSKQLALRRTKSINILLIALIWLYVSFDHGCIIGAVQAEDPPAAPAFDMGALASLASNIGSNPQIMSVVSSLLNPSATAQKPSIGSLPTSGAASSSQQTSGNDLSSPPASTSDQDPNSILQQESSGFALRRNSSPRQQESSVSTNIAPVQQQQSQSVAQAPSSQQSPLNGLLSIVPGVLNSLSSGGPSGGGLAGPLGSLLGLGSKPSASTSANKAEQASESPQQAAQQPTIQASASLPTQSAAASPSGPANSAQTVINQVLTAYASGQIPNELIQLSLSGRIPPQLIELALSGQVPPQMIQMIITGQVPMSTINAFLNAMQAGNLGGAAPTTFGKTQPQAGSRLGSRISDSQSSNGLFSTTKNLFEALFGLVRSKDSNQQGLTVPTLVGNIPLRMPSIPNVRSLGQMVGGTITNVASMIPF